MITKAIEKLTAESNRLNSNHSQAIAEYLIDHITEDSAARIVHDSKSLEGCVRAISSKAKSKAVNNCAMISDQEVYSWVNEYYGIQKPEAKKNGLNLNLLDLL